MTQEDRTTITSVPDHTILVARTLKDFIERVNAFRANDGEVINIIATVSVARRKDGGEQ